MRIGRHSNHWALSSCLFAVLWGVPISSTHPAVSTVPLEAVAGGRPAVLRRRRLKDVLVEVADALLNDAISVCIEMRGPSIP